MNMHRFLIIVEDAGNNYSAYSPDLPGCVATGDTVEEVEQNMREAIEFHLEGMRLHGEPIPEPSELEVFLTARFRLYAQRAGRLLKADIEHPPWPLQRARATRLEETLTRAAGLPSMKGEPLTHFASRVDVMVARVEPV